MSAPHASAVKPLDWSARSLRDLLLIDAFYAQFGVYRVRRNSVQIVRVLHQMRRYFN